MDDYKCENDKEVDIRPFSYAISLISGKWKMHILYLLWQKKVMRYNELKRDLNGITHKVLSQRLNELEDDQLIIRKEYPQVPPKVEYFLSPLGESFIPVLHYFCDWGHKHIPNNKS